MLGKNQDKETAVRATTGLHTGGKAGVSKGVMVALGALINALGADGRRQPRSRDSDDSGYLTWFVFVLLFIFILGMGTGHFLTVKAYCMAAQFQPITPPGATTTPGTTATMQSAQKDTKTVMTQSQATYTWKNVQPRFNVVAPGRDGAWHE